MPEHNRRTREDDLAEFRRLTVERDLELYGPPQDGYQGAYKFMGVKIGEHRRGGRLAYDVEGGGGTYPTLDLAKRSLVERHRKEAEFPHNAQGFDDLVKYIEKEHNAIVERALADGGPQAAVAASNEYREANKDLGVWHAIGSAPRILLDSLRDKGLTVKHVGDGVPDDYDGRNWSAQVAVVERKPIGVFGRKQTAEASDSAGKDYSNLTPAAAAASAPKRRTGSGRRNPNAGMRAGGAGTPNVTIRKR